MTTPNNPRDPNTQILSEEILRKTIKDSMFAVETYDGMDNYGYYFGQGDDIHFNTIDESWLEAALNDTLDSLKPLLAQQAEAVAKETERNLIDQVLENVSHDPNPTTWALQAKLASLNQEKPS